MDYTNHRFAVATHDSREYNRLSKDEMRVKSQLEGNIDLSPIFKIRQRTDVSVGQALP